MKSPSDYLTISQFVLGAYCRGVLVWWCDVWVGFGAYWSDLHCSLVALASITVCACRCVVPLVLHSLLPALKFI